MNMDMLRIKEFAVSPENDQPTPDISGYNAGEEFTRDNGTAIGGNNTEGDNNSGGQKKTVMLRTKKGKKVVVIGGGYIGMEVATATIGWNLDTTLTASHIEPSSITLYQFGNTLISSLCYELAYAESKGRMKRGNRVWKIAFGSVFKCNSTVWRALMTVNPAKEKNQWMAAIDKFTVEVPRVAAI
ncbi:uncharacterized protein A4U43_C04F23550 [Asparagus officinalis]|uniref:Pyridine nucleotide-disulphide oxidoreductase N-terminal domain-containing protein n=1 Tax=Asparagus officinalis TaxID=4686 RepID=A0A5P1F378_ASPOF|nr:uncharacterized protein A4U43_C04F23550 [Asparagus officinalis]